MISSSRRQLEDIGRVCTTVNTLRPIGTGSMNLFETTPDTRAIRTSRNATLFGWHRAAHAMRAVVLSLETVDLHAIARPLAAGKLGADGILGGNNRWCYRERKYRPLDIDKEVAHASYGWPLEATAVAVSRRNAPASRPRQNCRGSRAQTTTNFFSPSGTENATKVE